jgi:hypothetical protein
MPCLCSLSTEQETPVICLAVAGAADFDWDQPAWSSSRRGVFHLISYITEVTMLSLLSALVLVLLVEQADAQTADPPVYSVGDEWKLSTGFARRVVKVEGDVTVFQGYPNCPTCLVSVDKNLVLLKIDQENGQPADTGRLGFVPMGAEWKFWDFPLTVGKKWDFSGKGFFRNNRVNYSYANTLEGYEDVTTKAGTFKAFKVRRDVTIQTMDSRGGRPSWTEMIWFAPAAKTAVKFTTTNANGTEWELASYSVK